MYNAILVNPWVYDFTYFNLWEKPLGLLTLATELIDSGAASVSFIDCLDERLKKASEIERGAGKFSGVIAEKPAPLRYVPRNYCRFGINEAEFTKKLQMIADGLPDNVPTVVLVTCMMTYWYQGAHEAAAVVRRVLPHAKVAIGGIYARLCPDHARASGLFDHVETGFEPRSVVSALDDLAGTAGAPRRKSKTLVRYFKTADTNRGYTLNNSNLNYSNLRFSMLPFRRQFFISVETEGLSGRSPLYELMPELNNSAALSTATGCPYGCTYCASPLLYGGFTPLEPARVYEDISYVRRVTAAGNIAFYDDALLHEREHHFYEWAALVRKEGPMTRFHLPNAVHASMIDPHCAGILHETGFSTIRLGYEFFDGAQQRRSGAKVDDAGLASAVSNLLAAGYSRDDIGVYVMFGHPAISLDDTEKAVEFIASLGATPSLSLFSPIPGTPDGDAVFSERPEFGREPLLQNKSAFFMLYGKIGAAEYYRVKNGMQAFQRS